MVIVRGILTGMASGNVELVRRGFEAFMRGDEDALRELLDPRAQWLWYEPSAADCHSRDQVLTTLGARRREGVVTGIDAIVEGGELVFVEVTGPALREWGLPDGKACMTVTFRDGRIVRMQDHRSRADALAAAGLAPRPRADAAATTPVPTQPGADRVSGLIPFVHVADVEASIRFYEHLGFRVTDTHPPGASRLGWAALRSEQAELMLERTDAPIDRRAQAVLFYLYSHDLAALRGRLLAAGVAAGEIVDGTPGPRAEMRVEDPDGYVLMIAQLDLSAT